MLAKHPTTELHSPTGQLFTYFVSPRTLLNKEPRLPKELFSFRINRRMIGLLDIYIKVGPM